AAAPAHRAGAGKYRYRTNNFPRPRRRPKRRPADRTSAGAQQLSPAKQKIKIYERIFPHTRVSPPARHGFLRLFYTNRKREKEARRISMASASARRKAAVSSPARKTYNQAVPGQSRSAVPRAMNILMLYPKFPDETFWNTARSIRLLWGRKAIMPPLGLLTIA